MIEILLYEGANIDAEGEDKCTPLILGKSFKTYFNFG
jgi:hypothetical protein